uniref:Chloroplast enveloppe membrane protein n=1 Tax=Capsosiphon fulvescens TaxID=205396 RepID=A0A3G1RIU4_9CHLO|nr:chloroplast enveloppe membrane protein [Capsosiphon fulvescens]AWX64063.1 chloroplast enveloppe membrane protein [Capsosiphon fulvescens]AYV89980.1 chloroplast enveloppe membrane protein [Capsosiphon fulvescens]
MYKKPAENQFSKYQKTNTGQYSTERIGIIPRSIIRTLNRFLTQIFPNSNVNVIQEFRVSRYQVLVSLQCLLYLIFVPLLINILTKTFVFAPLTSYIWNTQQEDIFLNSYLEKEALSELKDFEMQLYFDYFSSPNTYETPFWASYQDYGDFQPTNQDDENSVIKTNFDIDFPTLDPSFDHELVSTTIQKKTVDLATHYNQRSIDSLTNLFVDLSTFATLCLLIVVLRPQIIILKSFLIESIYSLSDTTKSFLLILVTDLLVGFHSPRGWELFLEFVLNRFGFPHNENFIFLFVATFPVLLDTVFKYWIFRYLNKISPSTVATYHAMIE